jgi:DnaK suppressor protein
MGIKEYSSRAFKQGFYQKKSPTWTFLFKKENFQMVSAKEISSLQKHYNKEKQDLLRLICNSECEVDVDGDLVDVIQGNTLISMQNHISELNLNKLRRIERSLDKIRSGEIGLCEECEEPIGFKRLKAIPGVCLCIMCAEEAERKMLKIAK